VTRSDRISGANVLAAYLQEIDATPLLSAEQERHLAERVAEGDITARDHMVRANLRLVVNIARSYLHCGLALEDLVAEGNLGLVRAVEGFDPRVGVRFSTYSSYWIKQSIRRAVMNQGKIVRLPAHMHTLLSKWRKAARVLAERLGRAPSAKEIGRTLRLSPCRLRMAQAALEVDAATGAQESSDEEEDPMQWLADVRSGSTEDRVAEAELYGRLAERFDNLEEREATIVRLRYGLGDEPQLTLEAIGKRLGMTRERVRQLEKVALTELTQLVGGAASNLA
jgi:RNA polymerase primary sigma factor